MIKLDAGNVLLKPSHRKQMMAWLRRSLRLGNRLGDFVLTISLRRIGHAFVVRADVHDNAGDFGCRCRQSDWRHAVRMVVRMLSMRLHDQTVQSSLS